MIVGTAGHIDHGKTALVRALTGVDTDRLKEEKARGITIDLGFAYLPAANGVSIGFVDVPGHEKFVHTMVAGAGGVDFALLVVAADDSVMPQTREHIAIMDLLGLARGIVALTKVDLVSDERRQDVTAEIAGVLAETSLAGSAIAPVSVVTGEGVDALRDRLIEEARRVERHVSARRFRLAVDRSFVLAGVGTVVTGTVLSGAVAIDDRVTVSPSGIAARVRSIHAQNRAVDRGHAGDRCALNLVGGDVAKDAIRRGDAVLDPELHAPTDRIDATLRLLPSESKPVAQWTPARLHHAAADVGARLVLLRDRPSRRANKRMCNSCSIGRSPPLPVTATCCATPRPAEPSAAVASSICAHRRASAERRNGWPCSRLVRSSRPTGRWRRSRAAGSAMLILTHSPATACLAWTKSIDLPTGSVSCAFRLQVRRRRLQTKSGRGLLAPSTTRSRRITSTIPIYPVSAASVCGRRSSVQCRHHFSRRCCNICLAGKTWCWMAPGFVCPSTKPDCPPVTKRCGLTCDRSSAATSGSGRRACAILPQ